MVNVQVTNSKLGERARRILAQEAGVSLKKAARALDHSGDNLPVALLMLWKKIPRQKALKLLSDGKNTAAVLRSAAEARIRPGKPS